MSGHFGFFRLVFEMVDGKLHQTAEYEMSLEAECVLVVADDGRGVERSAETAYAA